MTGQIPTSQVPDQDDGPRLLAGDRRELILAEVDRRGSVRVSELTELFSVSDMTVRRDLDALGAEHLLEKVHGGARAIDPAPGQRTSVEPDFVAKADRQLDEKVAIARAAAAMIEPGSSIGLTAGTTTWQLAHEILHIPALVVVTNSLRVTEVLHAARRTDLSVVLTGGVPTPSDAIVGPVAERALETLHLDQVFMGVHGMDEQVGFSTPNLMEARTNQAFIEAAQTLVVLADHTKWGTIGLSSIVPLGDADVVVTDDGLAEDSLGILQGEVGEVVVASTNHPIPAALTAIRT